ncbi:histidine kinase dimerization/phosphoacceptor domain -containing protein [Sphingosinicella sp. BN140058]|uniref:histidine kinase dimerization/phosphoacceptor domain -containing protein n=1 Tax=Sphingosinicella sp. BN140058 TaxID=1892855 RepID=UPI00101088C9|nr:histidine kinase dimerization/phosphoacceptor domain -containing protein [Sphingosinicella sp. BN140058]QAY76139.1 GAF domain-containing protein [Sphingosinicella sp. BN140058]
MADLVDLTACDREPIHIPGAIQPHGLLLVADRDGIVVQCAGAFERLLGFAGTPLRLPLAAVLGAEGAALVDGSGRGGTFATADGRAFDLAEHPSEALTIVELEPVQAGRPSAAQALSRLQRLTRAIGAAESPIAACQIAAEAVRDVTGYDRIMVYRFLGEGAGRVIAESRAAGSATLLHQHFPASDIPQQARTLYVRNRIRLIPDSSYVPAPLIGGGATLDMSDCVLRSVSPVHLQYLRNMGVAGSASVSIVIDGTLWGLIACHADAPRLIPHEARQLCCVIGEILSGDLKRRAEATNHAQVLRFARRREELVPLLLASDRVETALEAAIADVAALVPCDGAAVWSDGAVTAFGSVPDEEALLALGTWLLRDDAPGHFATPMLAAVYPPASGFTAAASGIAAAIVRREPGLVLAWFRAEQVETVNWAGNPHKAAEPGSGGLLTPRTSFDLWRETVRGRSLPWTETELEAIRRFGDAVRDVAEHKNLADLNRQLRAAVGARDEIIDKKDLLMREVHHRVQNSLQLVTSMLHIQAADVDDEAIRHQFELARQRVMAVAMAHRRLWRADEADTINLDTFLEEIGESLLESWGPDWQGEFAVHVAPVRIPTSDAVVLALLVTELLTNAVKHAYDGAVGPLELRAERKAEGTSLEVSVCDRGKGFTGGDKAGSFGSRLTRGLVRQLKGRIDFLDNQPGTRAILTLPHRSA